MKKTLVTSVISLLLCFSMIAGSTFALFTSDATTDIAVNSGKVEVSATIEELLTYSMDVPQPAGTFENGGTATIKENTLTLDRMTPGDKATFSIAVENKSTVDVQYRTIVSALNDTGLFRGLKVTIGSQLFRGMTARSAWETLAAGKQPALPVIPVTVELPVDAGNDHQDASVDLSVIVEAIQANADVKNEDNSYPDVDVTTKNEIPVTVVDGVLVSPSAFESPYVQVTIPAGVKVEHNSATLPISITHKAVSDSNITTEQNERLNAFDVHVDGIAADNTVPVIVKMNGVLPKNMNSSAIKIYHIENKVTVAMQYVPADQPLNAHNMFHYDPATGDLTVAMASFSEVATLIDTTNPWDGTADKTWYNTTDTTFTLRNAQQLAGFAQLVTGENTLTSGDTFSGKTVCLAADIDLSGQPFYPIGVWSEQDGKPFGVDLAETGAFCGTFDGMGHTIKGLNQNGWSMSGSYSDGYYMGTLGLFGYLVNATVQNLNLDGFTCVMEFTPVGAVAGLAKGNCRFQNIAVTNADLSTYNTGVAAIVGSEDTGSGESNFTFENITVDASNTIRALWGTYDCAAGGIMGYLCGDSTASFHRCNVAAVLDVYNDVCGNYQYYWYRYCGMYIGTVDKMATDENGRQIPDLSGITATDCTVSIGDWSNYYYCEFESAGHPSYAQPDQYKFRRCSEEELVRDAEGNVIGCTHAHTDVEDNRAICLKFNQLFNGYGWGVKATDLKDYPTIQISDITENEEKFTTHIVGTADAPYAVDAGAAITVDTLFSAINGKDINHAGVYVSITKVHETDTVAGTFRANTADWTQGTLAFTGEGLVKLTIQDYLYCTPTELYILVQPRESVQKFTFENKLPHTAQYLYRVGNANPIALGSLFEAINGVEINASGANTTIVKIEPNDLTGNVEGAFTANAADWAKGTLRFTGTGVVKLTITDDDFCTPTELYLEVVEGRNVTQYSELINGSCVLLSDITMPSDGQYYLSNAALYGNGFTFDVTAGKHGDKNGSMSNNYVICLRDAALDNIKIIGSVYTSYGAAVKDDYNFPIVLSTGQDVISNSYISNGAAPVRVNSACLTIENTTLKGGNFANLDIRNGQVVLDNVTTINQVSLNDTANGTVVTGLGIVSYYENVLNTTTITIKNGIRQYNHLQESDANYIKDSQAKTLFNAMFNYADAIYTDGSGNKWVNTGIISMSSAVGDANISDISGYIGVETSLLSSEGFAYVPAPAAPATSVDEYEPTAQGAIAPAFSFDYTAKNYVAKTDGSNDYCYEDGGVVRISFDEGDTFHWDTAILTVTKNGQPLPYTVSMNGTDYTGKRITFSEGGEYTVVYTYTDSNNYVMSNGAIDTESKTYEKTVTLSVSAVKAAAKHATFTFGLSNTAGVTKTIGDKTYVMPNVSAADNTTWGSITVESDVVYFPITEADVSDKKNAYFYVFKNIVAITDYADGGAGAAVAYNGSTTELPSNLVAVKGAYDEYSITTTWTTLKDTDLKQNGPANIFKYASASAATSTPTTKSSALCYKSPDVSGNKRAEYYTLVQYSYTDNAGSTYYYYVGYHMNEKEKATCITSDTMVNLADGTQKRADEVTSRDILLAWDFHTGSYAAVPASVLFYHGHDLYEVLSLHFSDGTTVKVIEEHGFFDTEVNSFVYMDAANVTDYIGHRFVKATGDSYTEVTLESYTLSEEYTGSYSIQSAVHNSFIVEGMWSMTPPPYDGWFDYFAITDDMVYDETHMEEEIATYGLTDYADYAHLVTYEQFLAFNGQYLNVLIGRGVLTQEQVYDLISMYVNPTEE